MKFRTGKYAGLTVDHVKKIAPWYIQWVRENRPEMLKERAVKPKVTKPNYDFLPDKPSPYLASPEEAFGMNFPTKSS
tara:strand:- start:193 stop:423 length:231 start_codon:yes stop_codon:yes gene_type:complete